MSGSYGFASCLQLFSLYSTIVSAHMSSVFGYVPNAGMEAITLDREVDFIWRKRWTVSKTLFIYNRYMGAFILIAEAILFMDSRRLPHDTYVIFMHQECSSTLPCLCLYPRCFTLLKMQAWLSASVVWCMQAILIMRVFALYNNSRRIFSLIAAGFVLEVGAILILKLKYQAHQVSTEPVPGLHICTPINVPELFWTFWVPIIIFEFLLMLFPLRMSFDYLRHMLSMPRGNDPWIGEVLLNILIRDSLLYFLVVTLTYLAIAIMWARFPAIWIEIPEGFSGAMTCIMGSRLTLNMREAFYKPFSTVGRLTTFKTPPGLSEFRDALEDAAGHAYPHKQGTHSMDDPTGVIGDVELENRSQDHLEVRMSTADDHSDLGWNPMTFRPNESLENIRRMRQQPFQPPTP
ncbi:hypothetical protein PUNSTDRAFT_141373 [Punctularia strigosozonata HHB-11173 SS5]|uniref:uncharacterized protein n=1 Tax=Punctularia strigosozonata (strain HHB-11173) TaxID=741275 RepID=UPI000441657B|nr:uncharacterized protein PUNSTDRAFT_141373 [Punctularia strigosozonata HHB-11173 SS5]EIN12765.1 hypothetical protein PUNSTDRAFT_141373 [Punctularia strigosozonata HHB-11173 SS5]